MHTHADCIAEIPVIHEFPLGKAYFTAGIVWYRYRFEVAVYAEASVEE
jgi:hypothetical protein